jgi:hypothetical protein
MDSPGFDALHKRIHRLTHAVTAGDFGTILIKVIHVLAFLWFIGDAARGKMASKIRNKKGKSPWIRKTFGGCLEVFLQTLCSFPRCIFSAPI